MKNWLQLSNLMFVLFAIFSLSSCTDDPIDDSPPPATLLSTLQDDPDVSIFVAAIDKVGLNTTLQEDGPHTVFAPGDTEFNTWLSDRGFSTIDDVDVTMLGELVASHILLNVGTNNVVAGYYDTPCSTSFADNKATMLISENPEVVINGDVRINSTETVPNGVIHAVDNVISIPNLDDFIVFDNVNFNIFEQALYKVSQAGGYTDFWGMIGKGAGFENNYYTVFAPTDEAFSNLLADFGWTTLDDVPLPNLNDILRNHFVEDANVVAADLSNDMLITSMSTVPELTVTIDDLTGEVSLSAANSAANVITANLQTKNGVIHIIDGVLRP